MSDELIVCIAILILSAIITAIAIIYICALLAITKTEEYQKDERHIIRDPADIIRRVPEDISRADNLKDAAKAVSEKISGEIEIISIESRGDNHGDVERESDQDNRRDSDRDGRTESSARAGH